MESAAGIEGVPVAVDDAGPVVGADEVADVHVGDGVAVDLVSVVEGVAEGDECGEEAVERPETTQPVSETSGLRRVDGHEAANSSEVFLPSSQMGRLAGDMRVASVVESRFEVRPSDILCLATPPFY